MNIGTKVPFNDTARIYNKNRAALSKVMSEVAESGWWLLGKQTQAFAEEFSAYCGVNFCIPVANGTDALELAIKAVIGDASVDAKIITVSNAGGYSSIACRLAGVTPVYVDIVPETLLIDIDSLKVCLRKNVKAVIITHLFGAVVDVKKVRRVLDESGFQSVKIIEDCAQSHGAQLEGRRVGSLGDIAAFSFYPTKNLGAMGDAGAVMTNSELLSNKVKELQQYGWSSKYKINIAGGRNSRMDEIQAGILRCLLPFLDSCNHKRNKIYDTYKALGAKGLYFQQYHACDFVGHLAVIRTPEREKFITYMKESGVMVDVHYPVLDIDQVAWHSMPFMIDEQSNLEASRAAVKEVVSLPCFPTMTNQEIDQVCHALLNWKG
ncbi:erythromycin biosynthesis sensory transduction protein EryC1 [Pseudodesulfovibrio nedwellii]|uniref:Erythromycin biosynthesis sensory transduction protein EryC1 n=1 Tax=Pseudodesulfovibrio nedwellii TaxID=2973072 RepID=A0ABM8B3R1_9BACT|nr:DegT/DnrJ/EryC1/StrS family aminotransferase [Pseudodesulfovibrio nedwellii]BDQ38459.1 erythromycin biosynthesis sensory transduction protein EryC1 [Pseudodesulfovibrio nedwellii]